MTVLDDLLAATSQQGVLDAEVLPALRGAGVATTDWSPGSLTRGDAFTAAYIRALSKQQQAVIAASRFGDYVFGFTPMPNATPQQQADLLAWAPIIAKQVFGVDRIEASPTLRAITLTNATAATYSVPAGRLMIVFPSGNRYVNSGGYVSAGHDTVVVQFRSEFVNDSGSGRSYNTDATNATLQLVTSAYSGVTATNPPPATANLPISQVGPGLGTLSPSGSPIIDSVMAVRIDGSGQSGVATWSVAIGGGAFVSQGSAASATVNGITITLNNAAGGSSPSFVAGTLSYFTAPGTDIIQVGRDVETPQALGLRCRAVFPLLAFTRDGAGNALPISPTAAAYAALVLTAFPTVATCYAVKSANVNDLIYLFVAGQGVLVPTTVITQVQAYLDSLAMITDRVIVLSPSTHAITLAGATVKCRSAQLAAAQVEAQRRVALYLAGLDVNAPLPYGGLVDRSYVLSLIRTVPGVTHVDDALTINGAAADYQLGGNTMASYSGDVASSLAWSPS